jgi:hypothetical protein
MAGMLTAPKGKHVAVEEMNAWRWMPALDTNVLVRYIVQGDAAQVEQAMQGLRAAAP